MKNATVNVLLLSYTILQVLLQVSVFTVPQYVVRKLFLIKCIEEYNMQRALKLKFLTKD